jgi:pimeloyl-ACP methyl ester carboxylesterase
VQQSRLVVLAGVAHFPYWEAPDTLRRLLREFLDQER